MEGRLCAQRALDVRYGDILMTPEETLVFLVYTAALMGRKSTKHFNVVTNPAWINDLYATRTWLHERNLTL